MRPIITTALDLLAASLLVAGVDWFSRGAALMSAGILVGVFSVLAARAPKAPES